MKQEIDPKLAVGIAVAVAALIGGIFYMRSSGAFGGRPDTKASESAGSRMMDAARQGGAGGGGMTPSGQPTMPGQPGGAPMMPGQPGGAPMMPGQPGR